MRYISNTPAQQEEMLRTIGVASIEDLLVRVPPPARLSRPLNLTPAMAEMDLVRHLRRSSAEDAGSDDYACFLGAGSYDHAIPSPINHLISRGEFFTAYTPYQPEVSQGTLQAVFEYQSLLAELLAMDVVNSSMYDGGSATAEAALMAVRLTGRRKVVVSSDVDFTFRRTLRTYARGAELASGDLQRPGRVVD